MTEAPPLGRCVIPSELTSTPAVTETTAGDREDGTITQCEHRCDGPLSCRISQRCPLSCDLPFGQALVSLCGVQSTHLPIFNEPMNVRIHHTSGLVQLDEKYTQTQSAPPPQLPSNNMSVCTAASSRLLSGWDDSVTRGPGMHVCQWMDQGIPCRDIIRGDKRDISLHLHKKHNIAPGAHKMPQNCQWLNCSKVMRKESIFRHILAVHLGKKTRCDCGCGQLFSRNDSLRRHLKNVRCQGNL